jgi:hypothetical protein
MATLVPRWPVAVAVVGTLLLFAAACGGSSASSDPPVLVPWSRIGDIALGESKTRVQREFGGVGQGYRVIQRYGNTVQGAYRLHGTEVMVTFEGTRVNELDFVTPYYRTESGFGVGSAIPLGGCHKVKSGGCEHRWHGFVLHPKWKDSPCNCWIKVGLGANSLPVTGTFLMPWFFIFTKHGRVAEFFFSLSYID